MPSQHLLREVEVVFGKLLIIAGVVGAVVWLSVQPSGSSRYQFTAEDAMIARGCFAAFNPDSPACQITNRALLRATGLGAE